MPSVGRAWALLAMLAGASCAKAPGRVEITFAWEGVRPLPDERDKLWLHASVLEREKPDEKGTSLRSKAVRLSELGPISLDPIPNRTHLVAVVEVTDGPNLAPDRIRYFGISNEFSLEPGKTATVEVRIRIKPVPGGAGLAIHCRRTGGTDSNCLVRDPLVTLEITASDAKTLEIAQTPTFTIGDLTISSENAIARSSTFGASFSVYTVSYDLCAGRQESQTCPDGPRTLFARVLNLQGYASDVLRATVTLDREGPNLVERSEALILIPADDNEIRNPKAARQGTTVRIAFTLDKPIDPATRPVMTAEGPLHAMLAFAPTPTGADGTSTRFEYERVIAADDPQGTYRFSVTAMDPAGNERTSALRSSLVVKQVRPPPPNVDKITYYRIPWGSCDPLETCVSGSNPKFTITGTIGAAIPEMLIIAYDPLGLRLADAGQRAASDGTFPRILLPRTDREDVRVAAADDAGNLSEAVRVRKVKWTATLWGKVPGHRDPNPHRVGSATSEIGTLSATLDEPSNPGLRLFGSRDGPSLESQATDTWTQVGSARNLPDARADAKIAYDAARGRIVLYGGNAGRADIADTWEWDGSDWHERRPSSTPCRDYGRALAYDAAHGRTVLFGAGTEICEWDGSNWLRRQPTARHLPFVTFVVAYDGARGRVVIVAKYSFAQVLAETWEWDGSEWLKRTPRSSPSIRLDAMAYDEARGRNILVGADMHTGALATWEWDGSNWLERQPTVSPPARSNFMIAYDRSRGRMVLFGGHGPTTDLADTWEWDGSNWSERRPISSPPARAHHALAYDAARRRIVMFGGGLTSGPGITDYLGDSWEWDGTSWLERRRITTPPGRSDHGIAGEAARRRLVMFGGRGPNGNLGDTWEWDGANWIEQHPTLSPPARYGLSIGYDAGRDRVLAFGGDDDRRILDDTWEWDGSDWLESMPASSPPSRRFHAMAYDGARRRILMFGGGDGTRALQDTWEWDGSDWLERQPMSSPSPRSGHAMAYDAARGRIVLFGGAGPAGDLGDTWEWDGTNWIQQSPMSAPIRRSRHSMSYDSARGRVVLFGGVQSLTLELADTWEWDGSTWLRRRPASSPSARSGLAMAYDEARGRHVVFGGFSVNPSATPDYETWELEFARRPSILVDIAWGAASTTSVAIDRVRLVAWMGGRGYPTVVPGIGIARPGASILTWDALAGRWTKRVSNDALIDSPTFSNYVLGILDAQRLVDPERQMHFRIQPVSSSGNGPADAATGRPDTARVRLDYIDLTVEYRVGAGTNPICGNGRVELHAGELCDDGNTIDGDGCSSTCTPERGWTCSGSPSTCVVCGNGILEGTEECDDGNLVNGDGCNDVCHVEAGWACSGQPSQCHAVPVIRPED